MNKIILGLIIIVIATSTGFIFSIPYLIKSDNFEDTNSIPEDYVINDKGRLFEMHDVILDGTIVSFSNSTEPYVLIQVNQYFKNPQDKLQLIVKGEFGLTGDFCMENPNNCKQILAYLYQDKNGNLIQGETFVWITKECDAKCLLAKT